MAVMDRNVLCNVYGGTEMMDNICDTFDSWDQVVRNLLGT
jgi:hypothetical protein